MELVYLWVKNYKNIHKQGFNFSPRFHCEFKDEYDENGKLKDNCELVICDKKGELAPKCGDNGYIENFFGDNINVTAIVGKNGSGKSSIIEILHRIFQLKDYKAKLLDESIVHYLLIYRENNKWEKFSNINFDSNIIIQNNEYIDFEHYTYLANEQIYISDYGVLAVDYEVDDTKKDRIFLNKYLIAKMIASNRMKVGFNLTTFMYVPKMFEVVSTKSGFSKYISKQRNNLDDQKSIDKFDHMVDESFKKTTSYERFVREWYIMHHNMSIETYYVGVAAQQYDIDDEIEEFKKHDMFLIEEEYNKYFQKQKKSFNDLLEKEINIYFDWYKDEFEFDFIDFKDRYFNNLSHGEQTIFGLFLNLYNLSLKNENKPISFLFDEPDLSLHPEWQRKYVSELEELLKKLDNKFQILMTSHSPFLLSDLPKQNILFLDTYTKDDPIVKNGEQKVGNCKVLKHNEVLEKKQTFGQNIHTLLSDSFFMTDGLMGEFAKDRIESVIKLLKSKRNLSPKNKKLCEDTISIIGEPFLKSKLEKMYEAKFPKTQEEKIVELKAEIERLENGSDKT